MKRIIASIEARMSSTRLPGKVMKPLLGHPVLYRMIERLKMSEHIEDIIIATTRSAADDVIEQFASQNGFHFFRGSEDDVLSRVVEAHRSMKTDIVVEACGDCPLIDPNVVDQMIERYLNGEGDIVTNSASRTFPYGLDAQVFAWDTLEEVSRLTKEPYDREHVSAYIYNHPEKYRVCSHECAESLRHPEWRLALDYPEDFELITCVFEKLYPSNPAFTIHDVVGLLGREPSLLEINSHRKIVLAKGQTIKSRN